jgi:hypothetical protein
VSTRRVWLAFGALAVLGSQAGHLLAYQLRFGAAAQTMQVSGAHAYFPTIAKTGLGAIAAITIGGLFMVGLARVLRGRALKQDQSAPSYLRLIAAMYTIQLALFVGQELAEAAVAGVPPVSVMVLLFWGTLGQLPVAMLGALALRWLLTRIRSAVAVIRTAIVTVQTVPTLVPAVVPVATGSEAARLLSCVAGSSFAKRGPPSFVRFSLN